MYFKPALLYIASKCIKKVWTKWTKSVRIYDGHVHPLGAGVSSGQGTDIIHVCLSRESETKRADRKSCEESESSGINHNTHIPGGVFLSWRSKGGGRHQIFGHLTAAVPVPPLYAYELKFK